MFGIFRVFLAILVAIGHLNGPSHLGIYSVFGFYILSGYLMTLVMSDSYGYVLSGKIKFLFNRILRIYPPYFAAAIFSLILLKLFGNKVSEFKPVIQVPGSLEQILQNVLLIFSIDTVPRLSPPTWALTVELCFYALICFGISRTRILTLIWVCFSVLYTIYIFNSEPNDWGARYYPLRQQVCLSQLVHSYFIFRAKFHVR